jgi:putative transposase
MTKPLSMDIRDRAMARLDTGETVRMVSGALSVAPSSVVKWSQRRRATGSAAPGKIGGHVPRKIRGEQADWLRARMAEGAFTLRGLVAELAERGLKVDYRTMWAFAHAEGLSFKKRMARPVCKLISSMLPFKSAPTYPASEHRSPPRWSFARPGPHKTRGVGAPYFEPGSQDAV